MSTSDSICFGTDLNLLISWDIWYLYCVVLSNRDDISQVTSALISARSEHWNLSMLVLSNLANVKDMFHSYNVNKFLFVALWLIGSAVIPLVLSIKNDWPAAPILEWVLLNQFLLPYSFEVLTFFRINFDIQLIF